MTQVMPGCHEPAPRRPPRAGPVIVAVGVALDEAGERTLLVQRRREPLAGVWEWPGGKLEPGERPEAALRREWCEEVGGDLRRVEPWTFVDHVYPHGHVLLLVYWAWPAALPAASPLPRRWVALDELADVTLPPANRSLVARLRHGVRPDGWGFGERPASRGVGRRR